MTKCQMRDTLSRLDIVHDGYCCDRHRVRERPPAPTTLAISQCTSCRVHNRVIAPATRTGWCLDTLRCGQLSHGCHSLAVEINDRFRRAVLLRGVHRIPFTHPPGRFMNSCRPTGLCGLACRLAACSVPVFKSFIPCRLAATQHMYAQSSQ